MKQYLVRERGLPQLQVLLCVREDGLQRATQELLVKVLRGSHQRGEGHGHLHLHSGKVLKKGTTTNSILSRLLHERFKPLLFRADILSPL